MSKPLKTAPTDKTIKESLLTLQNFIKKLLLLKTDIRYL